MSTESKRFGVNKMKMTCCKMTIDPQLFRDLLTAATAYQAAYRVDSSRPLSVAEIQVIAKADLTIARAQRESNEMGMTR